MKCSPAQPKMETEGYPIGFDETPPWDTNYSTTSGEKLSALVPYKKGWALWNKYRDRIRYIWNPKNALWLPDKEAV